MVHASVETALPALGSRGAINFDLVCELRDGGHHSGNWGGALSDPAIILPTPLACISNSHGRIEVEVGGHQQ